MFKEQHQKIMFDVNRSLDLKIQNNVTTDNMIKSTQFSNYCQHKDTNDVDSKRIKYDKHRDKPCLYNSRSIYRPS
jgi:hypothetical protein